MLFAWEIESRWRESLAFEEAITIVVWCQMTQRHAVTHSDGDHQAWEFSTKLLPQGSQSLGCKWHCGMNNFSRAFAWNAVEKCLRVCSSKLLASVDVYQAPLWVSCFKSLSLGRINLHIYCFFPSRRRLFTPLWKSLVIKRSFVHLDASVQKIHLPFTSQDINHSFHHHFFILQSVNLKEMACQWCHSDIARFIPSVWQHNIIPVTRISEQH